jgi:hypothetical protein
MRLLSFTLIFLAALAPSAHALEDYTLSPDQIVGAVRKHFKRRTGIELNFDRTELVTGKDKPKYREAISAEDAGCFRLTALALEQALVSAPTYIDLINNLAPSVTIGSRDNTSQAVPDAKVPVTMKPSTYVDLTELPINTLRIQSLIGAHGCAPVAAPDFQHQLAGWALQVGMDVDSSVEEKRKLAGVEAELRAATRVNEAARTKEIPSARRP